jgi:hypothetical protein
MNVRMIKVVPANYYGPPSALPEVMVDDDGYLIGLCGLSLEDIRKDPNIKIDMERIKNYR